MNDPDLDKSFGFALNDVARLLRKRFDQRVRGLGLSRAQWQLLAQLQRHEGINQSGLAELLELEPITVGRLIDRMEEAGWVERRADPADRRARLVFMTERARPVLARLRAVGEALRGEALAGLDAAERNALLHALGRIRANLCNRGQRETTRRPADTLVLETTP
jgi:DNA-binding MarR family transcriptional regulator